ncbi:MAG: glutamine--fructose-6-phosphate transaminase (isomerizing) [Gammaproteobacteria bacterium]
MCGIVGAIAQKNKDIVPVLLYGLTKLEYRGYDSAGIAVLNQGTENKPAMNQTMNIERLRTIGKVANLEAAIRNSKLQANLGIAHTRWATHGLPEEKNAHPILVGDRIALVHNGVIDNYEVLKQELLEAGYTFNTDTDTETIALLLLNTLEKQPTLSFDQALRQVAKRLQGAYALCALDVKEPNKMFVMREASPLVLGLGQDLNYIASDPLALEKFTDRFVYLEDGDIAVLTPEQIQIYNTEHQFSVREIKTLHLRFGDTELGDFPHYMLKEIYEQPSAIAFNLNHLSLHYPNFKNLFGVEAAPIFKQIEAIQIVACGTSYYAACVGKYWLEEHTGIPCFVEIASEFRYRKKAILKNNLLILISQSGETADTLSVLKEAKTSRAYLALLGICNVPESSLLREVDLKFLTHAGPEIGVCSTKAFTSQLLALLALTMALSKPDTQEMLNKALEDLVSLLNDTLGLHDKIKALAPMVAEHENALFLGRGEQYPIALEGALKLKEISYIHAEAYPAGELKHGPLALVDENMLVIVTAPNNKYLEKLRGNIEEIRARKGRLIIFAPHSSKINPAIGEILYMPDCGGVLDPLVYTVVLQLLAYEVALVRGTDVDKPRNLAKSVTVE